MRVRAHRQGQVAPTELDWKVISQVVALIKTGRVICCKWCLIGEAAARWSFYLQCRWSLVAHSGQSNRPCVCPLLDQSGQRWIFGRDGLSAYDPSATLAVHCGKGFDAG